jgi:hemerythrin-like metal-binding protein
MSSEASHSIDRRDPEAPAAATSVKPLGYAPMDDIHAELDALLRRVDSCGKSHEWLALLQDIDAHLRRHFEAEDQWMRETAFPAGECHIDEHAAVLKSSNGVLELARSGDFMAAPSFVAELNRWFPGHADYLDSALAAWMCKRQYGGKPVVLHRKL